MTAPKHKKKILAAAALLLLAGAILAIRDPAQQAFLSLAPEKGKPPVTKAANPSPKESVQQPSAEVLSHRVTEYHIDVSLDAQKRTLTGSQTLTWTHPGQKTVNEIYLHLYPNAFESENSTFMKESGGKLRGDSMPKDGWGSMKLKDIRTTDGISLLHRVQYVQPDDGNVTDKTLVKVRLPRPVKGGEELTLQINFEVQLPKVFARMGTAGDFVMAGQWFPKMSVYEPAGIRNRSAEGWNLHQYHGTSEFYSDFGIFSVRINVPADYIVAATGFPTKSAIIKNDRKTYQFYADDVHDFAWSASPHFVYAEEPFSSAQVPGVRIKLYLDPAHKDLKERYFYAAKAALSAYSKWFGSYPYSTLSIVVPPKDGNGAGGMEYPTLVTAFGASSESPGYDLERTVIHEIAHQYFYGIIASNEFEEPWLDEGFASYAEDKLMEQEYGIVSNLPIQSSLVTSPMPLQLSAWKYGSAEVYAQNAYTRGKLLLKDLERQLGSKKMAKVMAAYSAKYRFKHPATSDFQKVVEKTTGQSWKNYFNQYVYGGHMPDYAIQDITIHPGKNGTGYESWVDVSRKSGIAHEVPLVFVFKDGHTERKTWDAKTALTRFKFSYKEPLAWAMVDPAYTLVLENKHMNNYLKAEVDPVIRSRLNLSVTKLLEALLGSLSW
ncbi:EnpEP protein [Paenibacillus sp. CAA11]|uniref:M1 family metallopeptidase n=1 Tax=Paenibacillus sp. CAA11 TaxID=1532905 RepID=UPI000D36C6AD|nr:M1 family metallopeptidase [Paenibacillus sp. CAA11]AWB42865.1 EnpEP protein [Paenibacillus sp. CAA11]